MKDQITVPHVHTDYQPPSSEYYDGIDACISGDLYTEEVSDEPVNTVPPQCDATGIPTAPEPAPTTSSQAEFNFSITTKTKEPHVPPAPSEYVDNLKELQRFNHEDWINVRYMDVQKQYVHKPGFVNLQPNDEVSRYDASRATNNMEKAFAGITYALLKQRDILQTEFRNFLAWTHHAELNYVNINEKIKDIFSKSDFVKASNDTLQMICGHRAELIQHRRETILSAVKDPYHKSAFRRIPPSVTHLFEADKFSAILEKAGGTKKVFWENSKDRLPSATQNDLSTNKSHTLKPPVKSYNFGRPFTHTYSNRGINKPQRGTFQGRGGRSSRGRRDDTSHSKNPRARSPVSHRDRGGSSKSRKY